MRIGDKMAKPKMQAAKQLADASLSYLMTVCRAALQIRQHRTPEEDDAIIARLAAVIGGALGEEASETKSAVVFHSCAAAAQVALDYALDVDDIIEGENRLLARTRWYKL